MSLLSKAKGHKPSESGRKPYLKYGTAQVELVKAWVLKEISTPQASYALGFEKFARGSQRSMISNMLINMLRTGLIRMV